MLEPYKCRTPNDYKNALKEIIQQTALLGLARQGFFDKAAFYGGSSLRIAHGLDRFSEDLDFTLIKSTKDFDIRPYLKGIEDELVSLGLKMNATKMEKTVRSPIESAFLKGNTLEMLLSIDELKNPSSGTNKNELVKIKLEVDTNPPSYPGKTESAFLTLPMSFSYRILSLPSLFGGKLHCVLNRQYKSPRVKGRDYFDLIWFVNKRVGPDLEYLEAKLRQGGNWTDPEKLSLETLKKLLLKKFEKVDWEQARADVTPFLKDDYPLQVWSTEFFSALIEKIS